MSLDEPQQCFRKKKKVLRASGLSFSFFFFLTVAQHKSKSKQTKAIARAYTAPIFLDTSAPQRIDEALSMSSEQHKTQRSRFSS